MNLSLKDRGLRQIPLRRFLEDFLKVFIVDVGDNKWIEII